jgi:hypothetical protein
MAVVFGPWNGSQRMGGRSNALAGRGSHPKHRLSRFSDKVPVSNRGIAGKQDYGPGAIGIYRRNTRVDARTHWGGSGARRSN